MEGLIYGALAQAMSEIGSIGKDKRNSQQGFMYRGVDDVMNALQPILVKNKIFILPEILEQTREERQTKSGGNLIYSILKMKYTFYTTDGSSVSAVVIGEGMDSADKSSNKAMSVAFKYACFQVLCIPTEEMKDPDAECHDVKPKEYLCADCGKPFKKFTYQGKEYSPEAAYAVAAKKSADGVSRCKSCRDALSKNQEGDN